MAAILRSRSIKLSAVLLFVPVLLLLLVALGVLPVRAYATQKRDIRLTTERLDLLTKKNAELRERVRLLKTDDEIRRIARDQYAMVAPGEKLLVIPGLGDEGTSVDPTVAGRVPTAPVATDDSSLWQSVKDLLRFIRIA